MYHRTARITPSPTRPSRRRPRGFTLMELLIAIGIMLVLAAMAAVGLKAIAGGGNQKQTKVTLGNAASILAEYEVKTGLRRFPPYVWTGTAVPAVIFEPTPNRPANVWRDFNPNTPGADEQEGLPAPGNVTDGQPARDKSAAVLNTQLVLSLALAMPTNKAMFEQIDNRHLLKIPDVTGSDVDESQIPVLMDAWGNPIIFVPASGLRNVYLGEPAVEHVITSVKPYLAAGDLPEGGLPNGTVAPGARPFFASVGPDGTFGGTAPGPDGATGTADDRGYGDDNVYSFED